MFTKPNQDGEPMAVLSPSPKAGLYIKTRGGALTKVTIPGDCLAFQTGEALQIATGGKLMATPHCVRVVSGEGSEGVSRETFVVFMQPNTDQKLSTDITFGQFSKKVFDEHYGAEGGM
jgi:isopenicillin N synthase-like dioxygenase